MVLKCLISGREQDEMRLGVKRVPDIDTEMGRTFRWNPTVKALGNFSPSSVEQTIDNVSSGTLSVR